MWLKTGGTKWQKTKQSCQKILLEFGGVFVSKNLVAVVMNTSFCINTLNHTTKLVFILLPPPQKDDLLFFTKT